MKQEVIGQVKKFMSVFVSACTMHIILLSDRRILVNMLRENFSDTSLKFVSRRGPQRVNVVNIYSFIDSCNQETPEPFAFHVLRCCQADSLSSRKYGLLPLTLHTWKHLLPQRVHIHLHQAPEQRLYSCHCHLHLSQSQCRRRNNH